MGTEHLLLAGVLTLVLRCCPTSYEANSNSITSVSQCAISSITLFILFLVAYKGAGAFAKVNYFIFAALVVALVMAIGPLYFSTEHITLATYTNNENVDVPINGSFAPFSLKRHALSTIAVIAP